MSNLAIVVVSSNSTPAASWAALAARLLAEAARAPDPVDERRILFTAQRAMRHAQRALDRDLGVLVEDGPPQALNPHPGRTAPRLHQNRAALRAFPQKSDQVDA
jgi:hypothetical protein